jgi:hypothetical protein
MREGVLWTNLSLRELSRRLIAMGTPASRRTIRRLLKQLKLGRRTARPVPGTPFLIFRVRFVASSRSVMRYAKKVF